MAKVGYCRVSSDSQNLERQWRELERYGCEKIFAEQKSAKDFDRPVYQEMRNQYLREGDILIVHDLSRFGRNAKEIKNEWQYLIEEKRIDIAVLDMEILDTRKYKDLPGVGRLVSDLVLSLLSWMVEEERLRIRKAQQEGIEIAKAKGIYKGRKTKYHKDATGSDLAIYEKIIRLLEEGKPKTYISEVTRVSRPTIYKIEKELEQNL